MIMMRQCCFISCNKCTIQVRNVDNAGGYACEGREYVQKSVFSSQFSSETKTSLNKYNLQKKKKKKWDFPGKPAVKNSPFNAVGAGLIPDGEAKIPHTLGPNIKEQKQYCN